MQTLLSSARASKGLRFFDGVVCMNEHVLDLESHIFKAKVSASISGIYQTSQMFDWVRCISMPCVYSVLPLALASHYSNLSRTTYDHLTLSWCGAYSTDEHICYLDKKSHRESLCFRFFAVEGVELVKTLARMHQFANIPHFGVGNLRRGIAPIRILPCGRCEPHGVCSAFKKCRSGSEVAS
jgi:hypothetical protein